MNTHLDIETILRLFSALFVGMLIGVEREYRNKSAGLRTMTLICLGSAVFTMLSAAFEEDRSGRIAANIVTGIGFLGAGVIYKSEERVQGLTTAAIIWVTASLGMAIGDGYLGLGFSAAALVLLVLVGFEIIEKWIDRLNQVRQYSVTRIYSAEVFDQFKKEFRQCGVKATRGRQTVHNGVIRGYWRVRGTPAEHKKLVSLWLKQSDIREFTF
jgi:putative Mg2+ transporter-C (MgtC) family protein